MSIKIKNLKLISLFVSAVVLMIVPTVYAATEAEIQTAVSAYRQVKTVSVPDLPVPKVVEVPFNVAGLERLEFLVLDKTTSAFEPSIFLKDKVRESITPSVTTPGWDSQISSVNNLVDDDERTYTEIPLPAAGLGKVRIVLENKNNITTDSLFILLDNYVALPKTVAVYTGADDSLKTVLATKMMNSQMVNFPKATSNRFVIELNYGQPLRITEIRVAGQVANQTEVSRVRFLAQVNHQYEIYFDPDRRVTVALGEMGNLNSNEGVITLLPGTIKNNVGYTASDTDKDGIEDIKDNCVYNANFDQKDIDANGRGDVCDDFDKDGVINSKDNCVDLPNYNQADVDADGLGDVCDGVESRITEKYTWLPWAGMGLAGLVVAGLFVLTAFSMRKKEEPIVPTDNNVTPTQ